VKTLRLFVVLAAAGWLVSSAPAQTSSNPSNTLVRFRIWAGTGVVGEMIVELFDQQKPVTVSNFLDNVRSGRYERTILHRSEPGFVVQGGFFSLCNPFVAASFDNVGVANTNPPIINETLVGPLLSHSVGTIAMATQTGNPDSATTSWFFNLVNNSPGNDTNNGGYCVFGRVKTGLNILNLFNTTSINRVGGVFVSDGQLNYRLDTLPVAFQGLFYPYYSDLFVVEITELPKTTKVDAVRPTVSITSPAQNFPTSNDVITIAGKASDLGGVKAVNVFFNLDCPVMADGTNAWSVTLTNLPPGTNLVIAQSVDQAGNHSTPIYRNFFHSVRTPLTLNIEGNGTVSGATNGEMLEINRRYVLVPHPAPNHFFAGWTGTVQQISGPVGFYMQSNYTFTAQFVTNLFPRVKGVYNGLFSQPTNLSPSRAGFVTVTVGNSVGFSGKVMMEGKTYPFTSQFYTDGLGFAFVNRTGKNPLFVEIRVDLQNPNDMMVGKVSEGISWEAPLEMDRQYFSASSNRAPFAAKHTLVLPGGMDPIISPTGDGFGTATVDSGGTVNFSGTLADGTRVMQRTAVSKNGRWPLYAPLYLGKGSLFGFVTFDATQAATDLSGPVTWGKLTQPTTRYHPNGFTNTTTLSGSRFSAPVGVTNRVLNFTNGMVAFTDGNLAAPFSNNVIIGPGDKVTNGSPNKLTLTVTRTTGLLNGSVTPPGGTRSILFKGAWLQKANAGSGHFQDTNQIGRVAVSPDP